MTQIVQISSDLASLRLRERISRKDARAQSYFIVPSSIIGSPKTKPHLFCVSYLFAPEQRKRLLAEIIVEQIDGEYYISYKSEDDK